VLKYALEARRHDRETCAGSRWAAGRGRPFEQESTFTGQLGRTESLNYGIQLEGEVLIAATVGEGGDRQGPACVTL
jgi:hypothetical protein